LRDFRVWLRVRRKGILTDKIPVASKKILSLGVVNPAADRVTRPKLPLVMLLFEAPIFLKEPPVVVVVSDRPLPPSTMGVVHVGKFTAKAYGDMGSGVCSVFLDGNFEIPRIPLISGRPGMV